MGAKDDDRSLAIAESVGVVVVPVLQAIAIQVPIGGWCLSFGEDRLHGLGLLAGLSEGLVVDTLILFDGVVALTGVLGRLDVALFDFGIQLISVFDDERVTVDDLVEF